MHFNVVVRVLTVYCLVRPLSLAQRKINLQLEWPDFNSNMQLVYFDNLQQCFHRLPQLWTKRAQGHNNIYLCARLETCQDIFCQCCVYEVDISKFSILFHLLSFHLK